MIKNVQNSLKRLSLKKKWLLGVGSCLVIMLVILLVQNNNLFLIDQRADNTKKPEVTREEIQKRADESMFTMRINSEIVLQDVEEEAPLFIRNPVENKYDTYVEIFAKESGKTVYKSKVLKPGEGIEKDKLENLPKVGKDIYVARFHILEEDKEISNIEYEIVIEVKKE